MKRFFKGKKVFLTGHTGFKGSWLCLVLERLGASVTGYALEPPTEPSLYRLANVDSCCHSVVADVRNLQRLQRELATSEAEIVIHMAAQSLVRESYRSPVDTFATNILGTVNLLEAARHSPQVRAVVIVTTDKVYDNRECLEGYREQDPVGGKDPYSSSKACAELVTNAYSCSFFPRENNSEHRVALASVRAGNVIGGGDWAEDRLVPDCFRALLTKQTIKLRNPRSVRPWQHVLEPLSGYLELARQLYCNGPDYAGAWNFGPDAADEKTVEEVVQSLCAAWGQGASFEAAKLDNQPHEAFYLKLDSTKARTDLGWQPRWNLHKSLASLVEWYKRYDEGADMRAVCLQQIEEYFELSGDCR